MADWTCKDCGSAWAPGAPACPECRSTAHAEGQAPEAVTGEAAAAEGEPEPEAPAEVPVPPRIPPRPGE